MRTPVNDISIQGRNTQGVRLIRLDEGDRLVGLERIMTEGAEAAEDGEGGEGSRRWRAAESQRSSSE